MPIVFMFSLQILVMDLKTLAVEAASPKEFWRRFYGGQAYARIMEGEKRSYITKAPRRNSSIQPYIPATS